MGNIRTELCQQNGGLQDTHNHPLITQRLRDGRAQGTTPQGLQVYVVDDSPYHEELYPP